MNWLLNFGRWTFGVLVLLWFLAPSRLGAQVSPHVPPNRLAQLQVPQPLVDVSSPVSLTAAFDPPTVQVGGKVFFRATVDAAEESIQWPEQMPVPAELKFLAQARGQIPGGAGGGLSSRHSLSLRVPGNGTRPFCHFQPGGERVWPAGENSRGGP